MIKYVREHGIQQFIKLYNRVKNIEGDSLLWGDEVEYAIFQLDETAGTVKLSLRGSEILKTLQDKEAHSKPLGQHCSWVPEWGSWMLEGTPARPYSGYAADLVQVERNMRIRRARILAALKPNEICPTVPCFPMMGVGDFTVPSHTLKPGLSDSLFIPDEIIHPAPRFAALVANIKRRRGSKVDIRVPRFKDVRTRKPQRPKGCPPPSTLEEADEMEEVYMDAMAFGMGCCCLQVTFQARDVSESRHLYDHLAVLGPMMLALTAATPIARGQLLDTDVRWDIIAQLRCVTACRPHHILQFCRFATRAVANSAAGRGCAMGPRMVPRLMCKAPASESPKCRCGPACWMGWATWTRRDFYVQAQLHRAAWRWWACAGGRWWEVRCGPRLPPFCGLLQSRLVPRSPRCPSPPTPSRRLTLPFPLLLACAVGR